MDIAEVTTADGMTSLDKMFGKSMGIGVRKKFPRVNQAVSASVGDNVNLLSPTATNKNKVFFCYDYGASKLNISVRYTKLTVIDNFHSTYLTSVPQGGLMRPNSNTSGFR